MWLIKRRQHAMREEVAEQSTIEVLEINRKVNQTANQTKKDVDRLNRLLKANGITLKIHIATRGGQHHAR